MTGGLLVHSCKLRPTHVPRSVRCLSSTRRDNDEGLEDRVARIQRLMRENEELRRRIRGYDLSRQERAAVEGTSATSVRTQRVASSPFFDASENSREDDTPLEKDAHLTEEQAVRSPMAVEEEVFFSAELLAADTFDARAMSSSTTSTSASSTSVLRVPRDRLKPRQRKRQLAVAHNGAANGSSATTDSADRDAGDSGEHAPASPPFSEVPFYPEGYESDLDDEPAESYVGSAPAPARGPLTQAELREEMLSYKLREPSFATQDLRRRQAETRDQGSGQGSGQGLFCPVGAGRRLRAALGPQRIVFVASEAAPYSKTGGLADVVGSLPVALAARGHRVMVVTPRYIVTEEQRERMQRLHDTEKWIRVDLNGEQWINYHHECRDGVDWVFVQHPCYERPGSLYGNHDGIYRDNLFRYALLSLAALEAPLQLVLPDNAREHQRRLALQRIADDEDTDEARIPSHGSYEALGTMWASTYGQRPVFVANDWHAGMVPVYLKYKYQANGTYNNAISVLAVHNLAHQGTGLAHEFGLFNLPGNPVYNIMEWIYKEPDGRLTPVVNIMKGALLTADRIVTVSEHYAWEITQKSHGVGLHTIIQERSDALNGIINGIDLQEWNPETDPHLPANYSRDDLSGKAACKRALLRELGFPQSDNFDVPLVGFIGRLDPQKGPDIVLDALSGIVALDCQVVMLGEGHPEYEHRMRQAAEEMPDFFKGVVEFSNPLAHRIIAACDILLMPSRFEPCGLNQLYAMMYGTVPVACATGGLNDTIVDVSPFVRGDAATGTGWTFSTPTSRSLLSALRAAVQIYRNNPTRWRNIQLAGMQQDFSWDRAASAYESIIQESLAPDMVQSSSFRRSKAAVVA